MLRSCTQALLTVVVVVVAVVVVVGTVGRRRLRDRKEITGISGHNIVPSIFVCVHRRGAVS